MITRVTTKKVEVNLSLDDSYHLQNPNLWPAAAQGSFIPHWTVFVDTDRYV